MNDSDAGMTFGERLEALRAASEAAARSASAPLVRNYGIVAPSLTKRARKDCPREVSSRKPVPVGRTRCLGIREQGDPGTAKPFDPRFEVHCGSVNEEHVERNFSFVDDIREKELREAKKQLAVEPWNEDLRIEVRSIEAHEARRRALARRKAIRQEIMTEEKEKVKLGKKPYFAKESEVRERELEAKFNELKQSGGVKKFIEKRRKRVASKDRRLLPLRRSRETNESQARTNE